MVEPPFYGRLCRNPLDVATRTTDEGGTAEGEMSILKKTSENE